MTLGVVAVGPARQSRTLQRLGLPSDTAPSRSRWPIESPRNGNVETKGSRRTGLVWSKWTTAIQVDGEPLCQLGGSVLSGMCGSRNH